MTNTAARVPADTRFIVLAALGDLGEATAAAVAAHAGLGYSTTTGKLRAWEQTGQVEKVDTGGNRILWRLTDTGRATTAAPNGPPLPVAATEATPDEPEWPAADTAGLSDLPVTADARNQDDKRSAPADGPTGDVGVAPAVETSPPDTAAPSRGDEAGPASVGTGHPDERSGLGARTGAAATVEGGSQVTSTAGDRRAKGSLRGAVLDILEAHPDRQYKTGELCKLIDAANAGTVAKKASGGAVCNAAVKLVAAGTAVQTVEKPATFQYASPTR